jgi:hypothetical protein
MARAAALDRDLSGEREPSTEHVPSRDPSLSSYHMPSGDREGHVLDMKPPRTKPAFAPAWVFAASFFMIAGILWFTAARLREELAGSRGQVATLQRELSEEGQWASILSAPGARVVVLTPTEAGRPELRARGVYDPATHRATLAFENFRRPSGSDYELWAIRAGTPTSLGVIKADEGGRAVVRLEDAGDPASLSAFAVSLEAEGGAPGHAVPTGPLVMVGNLGG